MQARTGGLLRRGSHIFGERLRSFELGRRVIEHRLEPVRRIVAVEAHDHLAGFVEYQDCRCELNVQESGQCLLAHRLSVEPFHPAVTPDVERGRDEVLACLVDDRALREIGRHQHRAVRAAILPEVDEQPLVAARGVVDVFAKVEERRGEPARDIDCVRRWSLRERTAGDRHRQRQCEAPDLHATTCQQRNELRGQPATRSRPDTPTVSASASEGPGATRCRT